MTEAAENQSEPGSMDAFVAAITETPEAKPAEEVTEVAEAPQEEHQEAEQAAEPVEAEEPVEEAPEEADPEDAQEVETPLYTVKINGVESNVPIEDLIAGFQKSGNYEQQMAELREHRETSKAESAKVNELRNALEARLEALGTAEPAEPDWVKLADEDPLGFVQQKAAWDANKAERDKARQEHEFLAGKRQHEAAVEGAKALAAAANLKSEDDMKAFGAEVAAVTDLYGFDQTELAQTTDHRILLMARDAARYRKQRSATPADKKVPARPKAIKPGSPATKASAKSAEADAARARLKKTGSIDDFVGLLMKG